MKDPLDDALGLPPIVRSPTEPVVPDSDTNDYDEARKNLYRLIAKAEDHLDELGEVAMISQHPRAFEVYSNLLKTTIDANKELLGLKKTNKEISGIGSEGPKTINNNLIMTTDEVLKMIKGNRSDE